MLVTNQTITQIFLVPDVSSKLMAYDRIRWYRSSTGRSGLYEAATAEDPEAAALLGTIQTRALHGTSLRLRVNGTTTVEVLFTDANPVTPAQVSAAISDAAVDLSATQDGNALRIATALTGAGASLEVLESDAAALLGFLPGETAVGLSADSALLNNISEYQFVDHQSSPQHWYMIEYRDSMTEFASPKSVAFPSRPTEGVPLNKLIGCFVRLCDLAGRPLMGRKVTIHNVFMPNRVEADGKSWGVFRQYEELITDPNGYAEAFLIRGSTIDMTISGTGFSRRIVIPLTGTIVDLLDPSLDTEDEFGIQASQIDFAIRTTS